MLALSFGVSLIEIMFPLWKNTCVASCFCAYSCENQINLPCVFKEQILSLAAVTEQSGNGSFVLCSILWHTSYLISEQHIHNDTTLLYTPYDRIQVQTIAVFNLIIVIWNIKLESKFDLQFVIQNLSIIQQNTKNILVITITVEKGSWPDIVLVASASSMSPDRK